MGLFDMVSELAYHDREYHIVTSKERQGSRNSILEGNQAIHMDVAYRQKKVKVHLIFSEEQDDKNTRLFYDSLKKIFMERDGIGPVDILLKGETYGG